MSEQTIMSEVKRYIYEAIQQAVSKGKLVLKDCEISENGMPAGFDAARINLEPPRDKAFGDFDAVAAAAGPGRAGRSAE